MLTSGGESSLKDKPASCFEDEDEQWRVMPEDEPTCYNEDELERRRVMSQDESAC